LFILDYKYVHCEYIEEVLIDLRGSGFSDSTRIRGIWIEYFFKIKFVHMHIRNYFLRVIVYIVSKVVVFTVTI